MFDKREVKSKRYVWLHSNNWAYPAVLVVSMELHHPLLQLSSLIGGEVEIADVVRGMLVLVIVPQLSLNSVGTQEGVSDEWAWQAAWQHVIPQLQAQVVSVRRDKRGGEDGWQSKWAEPKQAPTSIRHS